MAEQAVPEADALEQAEPVDDLDVLEAEARAGGLPSDVSEADALDQARPPVLAGVSKDGFPADVPEADALDQELIVPGIDEDDI
jgi:hypothetical protein